MPRPYGSTVKPARLISMIMAVGLLYVIYGRFSDPATWRWLTGEKPPAADAIDSDPAALPDKRSTAAVVTATPPTPHEETVIPGPNDLDEDEVKATADEFAVVQDRTPLREREMLAYWKLMEWSRTESYADLRKRARTDLPITRLWEQPEKFRAKPVHMRLHVRRVLVDDVDRNKAGVSKIAECWGWTDDSKSFPYVVIIGDPPPELVEATETRVELNFVGYFLKNMSYQAMDKSRAAPLFIGRGRIIPPSKPVGATPVDPMVFVALAAVGGLGVLISVFFVNRRGKRIRTIDTNREPPAIFLQPMATGAGSGATAGQNNAANLLRDDAVEPEQAEEMRQREESAETGAAILGAIDWTSRPNNSEPTAAELLQDDAIEPEQAEEMRERAENAATGEIIESAIDLTNPKSRNEPDAAELIRDDEIEPEQAEQLRERAENAATGEAIASAIDLSNPISRNEPDAEELIRDDEIEPEQAEQMRERAESAATGEVIETAIDFSDPQSRNEPDAADLIRDDETEPEQVEVMRERAESAKIGEVIEDAIQWSAPQSAAPTKETPVESKV